MHGGRECYERWALCQSDAFGPFLALISALDLVDFNLFIKEEDIYKGDFRVNWRNLFEGGQFNFDCFSPPIRLNLSPASPLGSSVEHEMLVQQLVTVNQDNVRLRQALVSQINQRAYFQDEYTRAQKRCSDLLARELDLAEKLAVSQRRGRELEALVDTHEQTNVALQRQLADAYAVHEEGGTERDLIRRLREAINRLGGELEEERLQHKDCQRRLEAGEEDQRNRLESMRLQIAALEAQLIQAGESWTNRLGVLQDQLKIANALKEEYKARLGPS